MYFSNSQQQLKDTIRNESNNTTAIELSTYVEQECIRRELDFRKVAEKVIDAIKNTDEIRNISSFVKAIVSRLTDSEFKLKRTVPSMLSLHLALDNFKGELWEMYLIDLIEDMCLNEFEIDISYIVWTNRAIVKFCMSSPEYQTLKKYATFLLGSKMLKGKEINLQELVSKARRDAKEYEMLMAELEEIEYEFNS